MKTPIYIILALAFSLALPGCSPYEEGPKISLRTKKARITGTWKLVNTIGWTTSEVRFWNLERDGSYLEESGSYFEDGTWEFRGDKDELYIFESDGNLDKFEILRLKNSELHLRDTDQDEWHFEKQ